MNHPPPGIIFYIHPYIIYNLGIKKRGQGRCKLSVIIIHFLFF